MQPRAAFRADAVLPWCRSLAGKLPRDLGEAMGRGSGTIPRVQLLAGLHQHDTNYHRRRDAEQDERGWWMLQARGAAATLLLRAAAFNNVSGGSDERLEGRERAQAVVAVDQSGRREKVSRMPTGTVWQA